MRPHTPFDAGGCSKRFESPCIGSPRSEPAAFTIPPAELFSRCPGISRKSNPNWCFREKQLPFRRNSDCFSEKRQPQKLISRKRVAFSFPARRRTVAPTPKARICKPETLDKYQFAGQKESLGTRKDLQKHLQVFRFCLVSASCASSCGSGGGGGIRAVSGKRTFCRGPARC